MKTENDLGNTKHPELDLSNKEIQAQADCLFESIKLILRFGKTLSKYTMYGILREEQNKIERAPYNEKGIHANNIQWIMMKNQTHPRECISEMNVTNIQLEMGFLQNILCEHENLKGEYGYMLKAIDDRIELLTDKLFMLTKDLHSKQNELEKMLNYQVMKTSSRESINQNKLTAVDPKVRESIKKSLEKGKESNTAKIQMNELLLTATEVDYLKHVLSQVIDRVKEQASKGASNTAK